VELIVSEAAAASLRHFIYSAKVSPDHFPDVSNFDANNNHRLPNKSSTAAAADYIRVFLYCALRNINLVAAAAII